MKSKFTNLIGKVIDIESQPFAMKKILIVLDDHFDEMCILYPETYSDVIEDIHIIVNGPYFDLESATKAVSELKNEDGTIGAKWTVAETSSVASSIGVTFEKFNMYDWHYALNSIYSDYSNVMGINQSVYFELAKAWINDKDAPVGKSFLYYKMMSDI